MIYKIEYFTDRLELQKDGNFIWKHGRPREDFKTEGAYRTYLGRDAGCVAGWFRKNSTTDNIYRIIRICGVDYRAHHIVWYIHYGHWPEMLDHVDGDGLNNNIENLRECTPSVNQCNRKMRADNKSGFTGVWHNKKRGLWEAFSKKDNKKVHIGTYKTFEEAVNARIAYMSEDGGFTERHGL